MHLGQAFRLSVFLHEICPKTPIFVEIFKLMLLSKPHIRFYGWISLLYLIASIWIIRHLHFHLNLTACIFKKATSLPCPACGTTTALMHLLQLDFGAAIKENALVVFAALAMVVTPLWLLYDWTLGRKSLYLFYQETNRKIAQNPKILFLILTLLLANWLWQIWKHQNA